MAEDYIKRSDAINAYKTSRSKDNHKTSEGSLVHIQEHNHILHILDKLPAADVEPVNRWISVDERLPDNPRERVLVYIKDANGIMGLPNIDTDRYLEGDWVRWPENVTHWQPLPEPPKGSD